MKKLSISLSLFVFCLLQIQFSTGQTADRKTGQKISWNPITTGVDSEGKKESFLACKDGLSYFNDHKIPVLQLFFPGETITSAKLSNTSWIKMTSSEMEAIDTAFFEKSKQQVFIEPSERVKKMGTLVSIVLVRKENNQWEKLTEYVLQKSSSAIANNSRIARITQSSGSVLQTGNWVKLGITQSGVYQITANDLVPFGLDLNGKNAQNIKMYGSGGKILSEANRDYNFEDLQEIAIQVDDAGDGVFNSTDKILFYAQEPHQWNYNASTRSFEFSNNIYSDSSYYFITLSDTPGKRINTLTSQTNPTITINQYPDRMVYAPDKVNVASFGRGWYADVFDFTVSKDLSFDVSGHVPDSSFRLRIGVMARSGVPYPFRITANGSSLGPDLTPLVVSLTAAYTFYGRELVATRSFKPSGNINNLALNYLYQKAGNQQSIGYLNFTEINLNRKLEWRNKNFEFRSIGNQNSIVGYSIPGLPAAGQVWDVTNPANCSRLSVVNQSFALLQDTLIKEFFAFNTNELPRPLVFKKVENQNLQGFQAPDLLIVTHARFLDEANRLADFRRSHDQMDVEVVTTEQVYNEFSSGSQDITAIRNMAMHLYYKTPGIKFKYLLLFGDCSYDYKNRISNNTNYVPTYQSPESLYILSSYASDDYFGILARNKGGWASADRMDIGVGRLPAKTRQEAKIMVDKLIHYASSKKCLGEWRNRYTFASDNGDHCEHSNQANSLSNDLLTANPEANLKKLFIGAYERVAGAGGYTSPAATNELINSIEKGSLIVNYTGHGGETVWADEFLFTTDMIARLTNYDRLSFFITATCDFGRHDYPSQTSGAESLLLNPRGGGIGIMTTGRPVGSFSNFDINRAFYNNLFRKIDGKLGKIGDVMRNAKNNNTSIQSNRGFSLLGDPSSQLAFPENEVVITNLGQEDTIRGLDLVQIEGEVRKNGAKDSSFNGKVFATLFDRPGKLSIIDDDPCFFDKTYSYQRSILYNGSTPVVNGKYSFRFYVSKNISFLPGTGRISLYAQDESQILDASGSRKDLVVGGLNPNPKVDNEGPEIKLFMNDFTFLNYGLVGENADLLVLLTDTGSGIDVTGLGMGHDLVATLDDEQTFILNDYFANDEGSYTSGQLRFPLRGLSVGVHKIVVKAWDNSGNSSEAEIYFEVGINNVNGRIVKNVVLYPNPFTESIYLSLENAYAGENIQISLQIYDIIGNRIAEKDWTYSNSSSRPGSEKELSWDATKSDGSKLPAGTYFCKILLKSDTDGAEYKINRKILLIR